jgi:hypothetical protein
LAKGERDWTQLDAFEAEYRERLAAEKKPRDSQYLAVLEDLARGRKDFFSDELKARDEETRRLFALRGKIIALRAKLGLPEETLLEVERSFVGGRAPANGGDAPKKSRRIRFLADPVPEGSLYPVTFEEIKALLSELPPEHVAPVREIRLSNQRNTGADGDWWDGEIRLHCLIDENGLRPLGRMEGGQDVERFGGKFEWHGNKLYARWPLDAYKSFILRRVLVHEVAHGIAELPGYAEKVRGAGSVEKFCEQYAENLYPVPKPNPGKARRGRT